MPPPQRPPIPCLAVSPASCCPLSCATRAGAQIRRLLISIVGLLHCGVRASFEADCAGAGLQAGDVKLVEVRNPWGSREWKGAYSDSDTSGRWTPELKQALKYDPATNSDKGEVLAPARPRTAAQRGWG